MTGKSEMGCTHGKRDQALRRTQEAHASCAGTHHQTREGQASGGPRERRVSGGSVGASGTTLCARNGVDGKAGNSGSVAQTNAGLWNISEQ
jgi:hypothetical protein